MSIRGFRNCLKWWGEEGVVGRRCTDERKADVAPVQSGRVGAAKFPGRYRFSEERGRYRYQQIEVNFMSLGMEP